jgi:hypothetical protein
MVYANRYLWQQVAGDRNIHTFTLKFQRALSWYSEKQVQRVIYSHLENQGKINYTETIMI